MPKTLNAHFNQINMRISWKLIFFLLIGYGAYQHYSNRPVMHGYGVIAALAPAQHTTSQSSQSALNFKGYTIIPQQTFAIQARVLSATHYSFDREADLAPVDLALGWGPMSDEAILKDIKITQSNRFYHWHVDEFFIPRSQIEKNSANMHMIPADKEVEKALKAVKEGQVVNITGFLVNASRSDGWYWKSSLSRDDTGAGACELVYVTTISVN